MNCERIQESFIDYQDGTLTAGESAALRSHLSGCPVCQREWSALQELTHELGQLPALEPSPRLREQFYAMLDTHRREADAPSPFALARGRIDRFFAALLPTSPGLQFAFSMALLLVGVLAGSRYLAVAAPQPATDLAAKSEMASLRAQVDSMGQLVTYSLLQQRSTSERLQIVLAAMDLPQPDRRTLTNLVGALAFDPSINVRLTAVEVLNAHSADALVRAGVLSALPRENAPLVQIAMIELLATAGERNAAPLLEKFARDNALDRSVRDSARRALLILRPSDLPAGQPTAQENSLKPLVT